MKKGPSARKPGRKTHPRSRKAKPVGRRGIRYRVHPKLTRGYPKKEYGRGKIPADVKRIIKKARSYSTGKKSAYTKKLKIKVEAELRAIGIWTDPEIERILSLTKTGQVSKIAVLSIYVTDKRINKKNKVTHYKVDGRWLTHKQFYAKVRMTRYWAIVHHYISMYGLSMEEARKLFKALRGKYGQSVFEALY